MVNQSAPILRQLVQFYTPAAFDMFQEQWGLQFSVKLIERDEKESLFVYTAHMIDEEGEWRIEFNPETHEICCSCQKFEATGILCCHALKVYESKDIRVMPEQYILKRWTKEARNGIVHDIKGNKIQADPRLDTIRRYRQLVISMVRLATQAAITPEGFARVHKCIIELQKEFTQDNENDTFEPVMEPENMPKGFKKRDGKFRKKRHKGWEEKNRQKRRKVAPKDPPETSSSKKPSKKKQKASSQMKDIQTQASTISHLEASTQLSQTQDSTFSFSVSPTQHGFPPSRSQPLSYTSLLMAQSIAIPSLEAIDLMPNYMQGE
ncbi:protein FAR1-RELATED SEQUENCE 2-like [Neltuma alba]|uniref:protein FAR1-RELATED SEQUENCE 2-like n=1 Tax=Neltuma alba TaxID=207710 RepID=UPI0010A2DD9E|nr:protein FAR1-RELATED SEQUENCE 2-like [Prosopis alba]